MGQFSHCIVLSWYTLCLKRHNIFTICNLHFVLLFVGLGIGEAVSMEKLSIEKYIQEHVCTMAVYRVLTWAIPREERRAM